MPKKIIIIKNKKQNDTSFFPLSHALLLRPIFIFLPTSNYAAWERAFQSKNLENLPKTQSNLIQSRRRWRAHRSWFHFRCYSHRLSPITELAPSPTDFLPIILASQLLLSSRGSMSSTMLSLHSSISRDSLFLRFWFLFFVFWFLFGLIVYSAAVGNEKLRIDHLVIVSDVDLIWFIEFLLMFNWLLLFYWMYSWWGDFSMIDSWEWFALGGKRLIVFRIEFITR